MTRCHQGPPPPASFTSMRKNVASFAGSSGTDRRHVPSARRASCSISGPSTQWPTLLNAVTAHLQQFAAIAPTSNVSVWLWSARSLRDAGADQSCAQASRHRCSISCCTTHPPKAPTAGRRERWLRGVLSARTPSRRSCASTTTRSQQAPETSRKQESQAGPWREAETMWCDPKRGLRALVQHSRPTASCEAWFA